MNDDGLSLTLTRHSYMKAKIMLRKFMMQALIMLNEPVKLFRQKITEIKMDVKTLSKRSQYLQSKNLMGNIPSTFAKLLAK